MRRGFTLGAVVVGLLVAAVDAGAAAQWTVGLKGGVSIASFGGDDADSLLADARTGFAGGFFVQADVSTNFGVRLEGLYTMKGASESAFGIEATMKLDYFEFPLLLVAEVPASESVTLSAFAGPVFGFNTKSELEATAGGVTGSVDIEDVLPISIPSFELGLAFGAGANFDVGPCSIVFDARYALGMTTIADSQIPAVEYDVKNREWILMAGVGFPVGGSK
jgi:Outer membrane protein beta-barrel domain